MKGGGRVLSDFHDSLRDAIYVFEDGVLVDANARVGAVSGRPTEDLLGVTLEWLLETYGATDQALDLLEDYDRVATGESEHTRSETNLESPDGTVIPVDVRFTRYETYVVGVLRNLSEVRERESQLVTLSDQLEVLNRVLRHDIRNDMNVVDGWLGELDAHVDDSEAAATAIGNVRDAVNHTIELTKEARDLAEVLTEGGEMPVKSIALDTALDQQVQKTRRKFPNATITLEGDVPAVSVRGNEMLSSVFDNLLGNAIVHNDEPTPQVTVSVTVDTPTTADLPDSQEAITSGGSDVLDSKRCASVRIADNGPGVPPKLHDDLFGRGEKGVESPGTGMGLYLVDKLVTGYGGVVHVEPNDPKGSVFVVHLPLADDA